MGWTFFSSNGRSRVELVKKELEYETDHFTQKVLDHSEVGSTVYLLVERRPKPGVKWEPNATYVNDDDGAFRWIAVFLTKFDPHARDGYNFGYKDLEESMGPLERQCPKRIITAASPLRDETKGYAAKWRQACLENLRKKAEARANPLRDGTKIKLNRPVRFTDGYEDDTFTARTIVYRGRNKRVLVGQNGGLYRVTGLSEIGYTVIA